MLEEISSLGFEYAELSHGIRISLVPGVLRAVEEGIIKISTVHNFCPLPMGVTKSAPNIFQFSSSDRQQRENAYRQTLKTLDFAAKVEARLVVLHCGSVEMPDFSEKLEILVEKGQLGSPKFAKVMEKALKIRENKKSRHLEWVQETVSRLVPEARQRNLWLGVENREAIEELPFDADFDLFFQGLDPEVVKYWHDCGHAQIKERMGLLHHRIHLEGQADRLAGFHIHDVKPPLKDHRAPGTGMIDFAELASFVRPEHLKVFEMSPKLSRGDVVTGVEHVLHHWQTSNK